MIAHFTSHLSGGSHIAARRLHNALVRGGVSSNLYYGTGESVDPRIIKFFPHRTFFWRNYAAMATSWRNRQDTPDGFITSPGWIRKTPIQATGVTPKVVHLHTAMRWLDLPSFFNSLPHGLPVVWTIHEFVPITGGCIYPWECDGFTRQCGDCPQLKRPGGRDASRRFFRTKAHWYEKLNLHFVGNSEWTAAQAKRSTLGNLARSVRMIHLGLNVEEYKPVDKAVARKALGIAENKFVIGFACSDFSERRKGADILMEALKTFPAKEIVLLVLGAGQWPASGIETIPMGSLGSPRLQSVFYSASDVLAMPSLVETFGLVGLEAMACETPVVAYPAGGLADVVADGVTGLIEPEVGSVSGLVRMLQWMWKHPAERAAMGIAARQRVIEKFSDTLMARRYADLYHELAPEEKSFGPAS
jgi:glycosyltransferase involved in cell wall biosynthesis